MRFWITFIQLSFLIGLSSAADPIAGRWDAVLDHAKGPIPFRLDLNGTGSEVQATLYNGSDTETTTHAVYRDGVLNLEWGQYLTRIEATYRDGEFHGQIHLRGDKTPEGSGFTAVRHREPVPEREPVPKIAGAYEIALEKPSPKGEQAWRFLVTQQGAEATGTILRVDGDTGAMTGRFAQGKFVLSHFDGARPGLLEVTPQADGSLLVKEFGIHGPVSLVAVPEQTARQQNSAKPESYVGHTAMKNAQDVFRFRFPDADGHMVSNQDPQFQGKVVLAVVTGTWCPNCHDEAQYLVQLYAKYKSRGLQIVALDFEEPEQQGSLQRLRDFKAKYGVTYPYLIAGAPEQMQERVPQAENLNTFPATFFIGRDGRVAKVYAGFAGAATGRYHDQLKAEFSQTIERLLQEPAEPVRTTTLR